MKRSALTTPPPRRPPPPKHPLFTTKFFSTKSFGPGHLFGAGVLVFGLVGISKFFIARGKEEAERSRRLARPSPPTRRPEEDPQLAQVENARGQYGRKR
jgi:hypothetical protein